MNHRLHCFFLILLTAVFCSPRHFAQEPLLLEEEKGKAGFIDPSDMYFEAWLKVTDAEKLEKKQQYLDAYEKYLSAQKLFDTIAKFHPDWKNKMVQNRMGSTQKKLQNIQEKAAQEQRAKDNKIEALFVEGGPVGENPNGNIVLPPSNNDLPELDIRQKSKQRTLPRVNLGSPADNKEVHRLHRDIKMLRKQLDQANRDRDANAAKLRKRIARLEAERAKYAQNTVRGEVNRLNTHIKRVEQERDSMALALKKSRMEQRESNTELSKLRADLKLSDKAVRDVKHKLQLERQTNNSLVDGLRRQLSKLQNELDEKNSRIVQLTDRVSDLEIELRQSQDTIGELKKERDNLLKERMQLTELLNLNEADRVQALIEQKVKLASQLRELRESVRILSNDNNITKDELIAERRQLALLKKQMIRLQEENTDQSKRLEDLKQRLREAKTDLESQQVNLADNSLDNEEVTMLKDIIERQLAIQERQKIYKDILIERAAELNVDDELRAPIENLLNEKIVLSAQEQQLIDESPIADGEFFNPGAAPEAVRKIASAKLQQKIESSTRVATRAFAAKRYQAAREVLELVLEDAPGHIPSLCNLGVVNIKTGNFLAAEQCFRDAIAMRDKNPFAHYGLGATLMNMGRSEEARPAFHRTLELKPNKAEAHVFLGNLAPNLNEAENHFNAAIKINPTLSEPAYNLALIKAEFGQFDQARQLYNQAIENGALPDPGFEKRLAR